MISISGRSPLPSSSKERECLFLEFGSGAELQRSLIAVGGLKPRQFCRFMFGLADLQEVETLKIEMQEDYLRRCRKLLSLILGLSYRQVSNWGGTIEFVRMPKCHQKTLWLYWEMYRSHKELKRLRRFYY